MGLGSTNSENLIRPLRYFESTHIIKIYIRMVAKSLLKLNLIGNLDVSNIEHKNITSG